jgi:glucosyl-dolichyl phosphate glucuronosyltransferase
VIICTYNRGSSVTEALRSIAKSSMPSGKTWEIVVVDNNSDDNTKDAVLEFMSRCPGICRYVFEGRQGKAFALNTGISCAKGSILAFVDDDVTVEAEWLNRLTEKLSDGEIVGAGGRTLPRWQCSAPSWFSTESRYTLAPFAVFDLGAEPGELREAPFGANMALRRSVFSTLGGFRTDLAGKDEVFRNEDTEFGRRILRSGGLLWYAADAVAYHPVSSERLRESYLLRWWHTKGRADMRESGNPADAFCVAGIPLRLLRRVWVWSIRWMFSVGPKKRFERKTILWRRLGELYECWRGTPREIISEPPLVTSGASSEDAPKPNVAGPEAGVKV